MGLIKSKTVFVAVLGGGIATTLLLQQGGISRLRLENESLRGELATARAAQSMNVASAEDSGLSAQEAELLRLRGEVTRLRSDAARSTQVAVSQPTSFPAPTPVDTLAGYELYSGELLSPRHADTMKMMKLIGLGLQRLEQDPAISAEAKGMPLSDDNDLRAELKKRVGIQDEQWKQFEILIPNLDALTLTKFDPGLIVARSREPLQTPDGRWIRIYTRGDGSVVSLVHDSPSIALEFGDLEPRMEASQR